MLIVRGGGPNVAALDHPLVARELFSLSRALPVWLALGHTLDALEINSLLPPENVCPVPYEAGRRILELWRQNVVDPPARLTLAEAGVVGHDFSKTAIVTAAPAAEERVAPAVHIAHVTLNPIVERVVVSAPSAPPPPRSRWRSTLALLGALYLLVLGVMGVRAVVMRMRGDALPAAVPASPLVKPEPERVVRPAEAKPPRRRARESAARMTAQPDRPAGSNPATSDPPVRWVTPEGREVVAAPPPSMPLRDSPLLQQR